MMQPSLGGLEPNLLSLSGNGAAAKKSTATGSGFSDELQGSLKSREAEETAVESDTVQDDAALAESEESRGTDEAEGAASGEEEAAERHEADADDAEERQEPVAKEDEAEEGDGNILPFALAAPTEALPATPSTSAESEGTGEMEAVEAPQAAAATAEVVDKPKSSVGTADGLGSTPSETGGKPLVEGREAPPTTAEPLTEEAPVVKAGSAVTPVATEVSRSESTSQAARPFASTNAIPAQGAVASTATARAAEANAAALTAADGGLDTLSPSPADGRSPTTAVPATAPLTASGSASPSAAQTINLPVQVPMQRPGWDQAMGERVVWMARNNLQEAQLQLNPRHLGPVEIRLSLQQEQASVHFVAATPQAREALEQSLPRLREMFADQGLQLNQTDVSSREQSQGQAGQGERRGSAFSGFQAEEGEELTSVPRHSAPLPGRLDYYA